MRLRLTLVQIAAVATLVLANSARAQSLRGTVRESGSRVRIPVAVVMTLDAIGATLARIITNERGEFRLPISANAARLRSMRIGYRALEQPLNRALLDSTAFEIVLVRLPTLLNAVRVPARTQCPARNDRAAAFGLWQQVQTALLATVVAQEANPALQHRLGFEKTMADDGRTVESMKVAADSNALGPTSFRAVRSAALLVEQGFVMDSA